MQIFGSAAVRCQWCLVCFMNKGQTLLECLSADDEDTLLSPQFFGSVQPMRVCHKFGAQHCFQGNFCTFAHDVGELHLDSHDWVLFDPAFE